MTKQQIIDRTKSVLDLVSSLPDDIDIMSVSAGESCFAGSNYKQIYLISGIELVAEMLDTEIESHSSDEGKYIHRHVFTGQCEYIQLDEKNRPDILPGGAQREKRME